MRMLALAVSAIVSLIAGVSLPAAAGDAPEGAIKKEFQALKGTWKSIAREFDGKKFSEEELKGLTVTWDEAGKFSVRSGDQVVAAGTAKIDPTKKPKTVDFTYTEGVNKGKTALGVYELEGDTYRLCLARPEGERPAEFSAEAGSGRWLVVEQREKK